MQLKSLRNDTFDTEKKYIIFMIFSPKKIDVKAELRTQEMTSPQSSLELAIQKHVLVHVSFLFLFLVWKNSGTLRNTYLRQIFNIARYNLHTFEIPQFHKHNYSIKKKIPMKQTPDFQQRTILLRPLHSFFSSNIRTVSFSLPRKAVLRNQPNI